MILSKNAPARRIKRNTPKILETFKGFMSYKVKITAKKLTNERNN